MNRLKNKQIALYFGTFNPIHVGHLSIANYIAQQDEVDEVWLVVSPQNPLKQKDSMLADYHRIAMVREAIADNSMLKASDIEFDLPQPSYTIDTLTYIQEKYPNYNFSIIVGEDNLRSFPKWKNYEVILSNFQMWVYPRHTTRYDLEHKGDPVIVSELYENENVHFLKNVPLMAISSSFIRKQIKNKKSPKYLLTPPVLKYIEEMHFYEK
jgi:nicotinate-nucleotide adenylyltransferase